MSIIYPHIDINKSTFLPTSGGNCYAVLDDASNADYMYAPTGSVTTHAVMGFEGVSCSAISVSFSATVRDTSGWDTIDLQILEGVNVVKTIAIGLPPLGEFETFTCTLTGPQVAAMNASGDWRMKFVAPGPGFGSSEIRYGFAFFETDGEGGGGGGRRDLLQSMGVS